MKKIILLALVMLGCFSLVHSQSITDNKTSEAGNTTIHPDASTIYLDENGKVIDQVSFTTKVVTGAYTFWPVMENDHLKSLQLRKAGNSMTSTSVAPGFSVSDVTGKTYDLKALRGKIVVLNFWFIGCAGCVQEMPSLNALAEKYKNDPDVVFLGITFDEKAKVEAFLAKKPFHYNIISDQAGMIRDYGINVFPDNMIIDARGQVIYKSSGSDAAGIEKMDELIHATPRTDTTQAMTRLTL